MTPEMSKPGLMALFFMSSRSVVLGTVHAFSAFLVPIETAVQVTRVTVSCTCSLILVCLTRAMLLGHRLESVVHLAYLWAWWPGWRRLVLCSVRRRHPFP